MREIPLTRGQVALCDDADYESLSSFSWRANRARSIAVVWYAYRSIRLKSENKVIALSMHRHIMEPGPGLQVDHINGNGLDNRRCNLRVCSPEENCWNRRMAMPHSSKFKGVTWNKKAQRWQAAIFAKGKTYYLGIFRDEVDAAKARDAAALIYHGEFALLNFPTGAASL